MREARVHRHWCCNWQHSAVMNKGETMHETLWERRRSFRIPLAGKALLQVGERFEGIYDVKDVSIEGCCLIDGPGGCDIGSRVTVTMHIQEGLDRELDARVVRKSLWGSNGQLGLRFVQPSAAFEDQVQDWTMRTIEDGAFGDVLVVHSNPEQEGTLLDAIAALGHRVLIAHTARETLTVLEEAGRRIHLALVSPVIGRSRACDVMRLIFTRAQHVRCLPLSQSSIQALLGAIRRGMGETALGTQPVWGTGRLRKASGELELRSAM